MTKEELEKEAIKASDKKCVKGCSKYYRYGFQDGYLAGAEPREKRIAELEQKLEQTEKDLADYQFNYPTIKELQKEIAELKSEKGCETCTKFDEVKLTKAKEIIHKVCYEYGIYEKDLMEEAKQFLKECK